MRNVASIGPAEALEEVDRISGIALDDYESARATERLLWMRVLHTIETQPMTVHGARELSRIALRTVPLKFPR